MKKYALMALIAIAAICVYSSCQKRQEQLQSNNVDPRTLADSGEVVTIDPESLTGVAVTTNGFLQFDDADSYEAVLGFIGNYTDEQLDLWESSLGFTSSRTTYVDPSLYGLIDADNENSVFDDEVFNSIIDAHGRIQIGDYIFKEEVDENRLLEIHVDLYSYNQANFDAGVFDPTVMNEFDADMEVDAAYDHIIDYLEVTGVVGTAKSTSATPPTWILTPKNNTQTGCASHVPSGAPSTKEVQQIYDASTGDTWRADCKSVYQKVGVYFSIVTKMKYQVQIGSGSFGSASTDIFIQNNPGGLYSYCTYLRKGKKQTQQYPSLPYENYNNRVNTNKLKWRPYEGIRGLSNHDLDIRWSYADHCGQSSSVHVRTNG